VKTSKPSAYIVAVVVHDDEQAGHGHVLDGASAFARSSTCSHYVRHTSPVAGFLSSNTYKIALWDSLCGLDRMAKLVAHDCAHRGHAALVSPPADPDNENEARLAQDADLRSQLRPAACIRYRVHRRNDRCAGVWQLIVRIALRALTCLHPAAPDPAHLAAPSQFSSERFSSVFVGRHRILRHQEDSASQVGGRSYSPSHDHGPCCAP
jgi:hypothetical protein